MANDKTNRGQSKQHEVTNADGSTTIMTQTEWKARDKSAGQTRADKAEEVQVVEEAPVVEAPVEEPTVG